MLSDYRDIIADLDAQGYASRAFYGLSFGGVLLLDALRDDRGAKSLIIDSSPSRLSDHGCPPEHDPVSNFPSGGARALVIVGQRDNVVSPAMSRALVERARQAGAEVVSDPDFGHPFVDGHTRRRFEMIRAFLQRQRSD
jgi:pimeloyl-ACP methyl ester carboxylesterase